MSLVYESDDLSSDPEPPDEPELLSPLPSSFPASELELSFLRFFSGLFTFSGFRPRRDTRRSCNSCNRFSASLTFLVLAACARLLASSTAARPASSANCFSSSKRISASFLHLFSASFSLEATALSSLCSASLRRATFSSRSLASKSFICAMMPSSASALASSTFRSRSSSRASSTARMKRAESGLAASCAFSSSRSAAATAASSASSFSRFSRASRRPRAISLAFSLSAFSSVSFKAATALGFLSSLTSLPFLESLVSLGSREAEVDAESPE
mmetsp:Transcript_127590/g.221232  ORF Transcript_127590/g.221232 Transcript_127590/m.221232 type:complete len:273 (-) Transcript_127590:499-1317(-)